MINRIKIYFWIRSNKILIDIVDFFNNTNRDKIGYRSGINVIDGALKCKDGRFFCKVNQKNILFSLFIKSEEALQDLINKKVLNPKLFVPHEEIEPSELGKNFEEGVFKNGKWFEIDMDLFDYLEELSFKFEDNSIPLTPALLERWYIPIRSNIEHNRISENYERFHYTDRMAYIIMDEEIKCKDGRILGKNNKITVCFQFNTPCKNLFEKLVREGLVKKEDIFRAIEFKEDQIQIDYFFWKFKRKKQRFKSIDKLTEYLKAINFKFDDNAIFKP